MSSSRKYDRPEIKQITRQWVSENCNYITDRDLGLLELLRTRRILRRDQIEALYPEFASTDRLNKRLKLLYQKHIIDRVYPPTRLGGGSSQQHICLDRAGILLLDLEKYNKPITTDSCGNKVLPSGWEHKVMINQYECILRETLDTIGGKLIYYNTEEKVEYGSKKMYPDIVCVIQYNGKGYPLLIEIDMGSEDIPTLKGKVDNYHSLYRSGEWSKMGCCSLFKTPSFPRILFFTTKAGRRLPALESYTQSSTLRFIYGVHEEFANSVLSIIGYEKEMDVCQHN